MMHKAWSNIEEVPHCFSRSSIKFQGHTGQKIADFDLNWAFPDCNFCLNSPMDLKWRTKLDVVCSIPYYFSRSSIKFQGHTGWKINDLDQIWARLLGRSQLSNPSDLPCSIAAGLIRWPSVSTSVVYSNTGLRVPKSVLLRARATNSSSSVHKPAYYWQRTGLAELLKSSASLTGSFFSNWSLTG